MHALQRDCAKLSSSFGVDIDLIRSNQRFNVTRVVDILISPKGILKIIDEQKFSNLIDIYLSEGLVLQGMTFFDVHSNMPALENLLICLNS